MYGHSVRIGSISTEPACRPDRHSVAEAKSFRQRMLDLATEYEALRSDRDKVLQDLERTIHESRSSTIIAAESSKRESTCIEEVGPMERPTSPSQAPLPPVSRHSSPLAPLEEPPSIQMEEKSVMLPEERLSQHRLHSHTSDMDPAKSLSAHGQATVDFQLSSTFDGVVGMKSEGVKSRQFQILASHVFGGGDAGCSSEDFVSCDLFNFRREHTTATSAASSKPADLRFKGWQSTRMSNFFGAGVNTVGTGIGKRISMALRGSIITPSAQSDFASVAVSYNMGKSEGLGKSYDNIVSRAHSDRNGGFHGISDRHRRKLRRAHVSCADWWFGTPRGQWLMLLLLGGTIIIIGAFLWRVGGGNQEFDSSWIDSFWISYCLFIDPGTQTGIPASDPERVKIIASVFSLVGFCFNLSFLGMIVELVKGTLQRWKKERYRIVLTGHELILGWTDKTLFLLTEMLEQAAKEGRQVVILAMRDEHEMMQDIRNHFFRKPKLVRHVRVCEGCPFDVDDLVRVSAGSAADIVVLCRKGSNANLEMVRVMVALAALPQEVTGKVIAEVWDADAEPVLEVLLANTDGISARPAIRRLFCLMVVHPLVAQCLIALCSAEAPEELRVVRSSVLVGKTFGQACKAFTHDICVGVKSAGADVKMLPHEDYVIDSNDRFLVIGRKKRAKDTPREPMIPISDKNDILICIGWCEDFVEILSVLDKMVGKRCKCYVLSEKPEDDRYEELAHLGLQNLMLIHRVGSCRAVTKLAALPLKEAAAILVLAEAAIQGSSNDDLAGDDAITMDSSALTVMVTITGIVEGLYGHERQRGIRARIICDVFDPRTDQLLARNSALKEHAVFFRSNALETAMFRTAAENPVAFNALNEMLCSNDGGSMQLISAETFVAPRHSFADHLEPGELLGSEIGLSFWDMHDRVKEGVGGLLIGWLRLPSMGEDELDSRHNHVVIAPTLNRNKKLLWRFGDHLLVLQPSRQTSAPEEKGMTGMKSFTGTLSCLPLPMSADREDLTTMPGAVGEKISE